MKKFCLVAIFAVFGFMTASAQGEFKAGVSAALPIGDAGDGYTFGVIVDANYLFEVSDNFSAGPITGVAHFFGDSVDVPGFGSVDLDDATFLPIGGGARFAASEQFTLGADIGYAIGIAPDGNDGGFYYSPRAEYSVSETINIVASYRGVSLDGGSFDAVGLGIMFGL